MTQNRDWEQAAVNYAAQQMMARQAQEVGMSSARQAAYGQACNRQAFMTEEASDTRSWTFDLPDGQKGAVALDGKLLTMCRNNPVAIADAFAHEVRGLLKQLVTCPTQEEYARALFESDPRVVSFVKSVADGVCHVGPGDYQFNLDAFARAMDTAYRRDESGWRTEAWYRAAAMITAINQGRSQRQGDPKEGPR